MKARKLFWRVVGENFFTEEQRKEGDGAEREENWRRGLTPGDELFSEKQGSCYRVYRHMGSGARKPVGFLGPAGSTLVGSHLNWHQSSHKLRRRRGQATGAGFKDYLQLAKVQVFFSEPSRYFTNK